MSMEDVHQPNAVKVDSEGAGGCSDDVATERLVNSVDGKMPGEIEVARLVALQLEAARMQETLSHMATFAGKQAQSAAAQRGGDLQSIVSPEEAGSSQLEVLETMQAQALQGLAMLQKLKDGHEPGKIVENTERIVGDRDNIKESLDVASDKYPKPEDEIFESQSSGNPTMIDVVEEDGNRKLVRRQLVSPTHSTSLNNNEPCDTSTESMHPVPPTSTQYAAPQTHGKVNELKAQFEEAAARSNAEDSGHAVATLRSEESAAGLAQPTAVPASATIEERDVGACDSEFDERIQAEELACVSRTAVCLVTQDTESGNFFVHEDGRELLCELGSAVVAPLAVAGLYGIASACIPRVNSGGASPLFMPRDPYVVVIQYTYRTGKSLLLNQLASTTREHFRVGSTTESCTRGIWLWVAPPSIASTLCPASVAELGGEAPRVLLLDTEGLASFDQDETYDMKIFSLGVLLSSHFVYNSQGVIDEGAISRLCCVSELSKNMCISADSCENSGDETAKEDDRTAYADDELAKVFPAFTWLLRDFSLALSANGEALSEAQYLENALAERPGKSSRVRLNNDTRRAFKSLFRSRYCETLPRPVESEEELRSLNSLPLNKMRPAFASQIKALRTTLLGNLRPKRLFGRYVTARMLAGLTEAYVQALNSGAVPEIRKTFDSVVDEAIRTARAGAAETFCEGLTSRYALEGTSLPSSTEFEMMRRTHRDAALSSFTQRLGPALALSMVTETHPAVKARDALVYEMEKMADKILQDVTRRSATRCRQAVEFLISQKLGDGEGEVAPRTLSTSITNVVAEYCEVQSGPSKWEELVSSLRRELPPRVSDALMRAEAAAAVKRRRSEQKIAMCEEALQREAIRAKEAEDRAAMLYEQEAVQREAAKQVASANLQQLDALRKDKEDLRTQLDDVSLRRDDAESECAAQRIAIERLETELRVAHERLQDAELAIERAAADAAEAAERRDKEEATRLAERLEEQKPSTEQLATLRAVEERAELAEAHAEQVEQELAELVANSGGICAKIFGTKKTGNVQRHSNSMHVEDSNGDSCELQPEPDLEVGEYPSTAQTYQSDLGINSVDVEGGNE